MNVSGLGFGAYFGQAERGDWADAVAACKMVRRGVNEEIPLLE